MSRTTKIRLIGWTLAVGLVGTPLLLRHASQTTAEVTSGPVHESVVAPGVVTAQAGIADVRARAEGRVVSVLVREGDHVVAGQLLAEIDNAEIKAVLRRLRAEKRESASNATSVAHGARVQERAAAEAELRVAQHALSLAEDRARRTQRLQAAGAESDRALFQANGELEMARARVAQAQARRDLTAAGGRAEDVRVARDQIAVAAAALSEAQERLDRTTLVAPIAGVVLARRIDVGDTVELSPGATPSLFEIADPAKTEVAVEVEEPDSTRVKVGFPVTLTAPGGRTVLGHGTLSRVGAQVRRRTVGDTDARLRAETRVRTAWVEWAPGHDPLLPIGARVEAVIALPEREALARVPRSAVVVRDGRAAVEVPYGPIAVTREVTLGTADEAFVEVGGIAVGTRVLLLTGHDRRR